MESSSTRIMKTITLQDLESNEKFSNYYIEEPLDYYSYLRKESKSSYEAPKFGEIITSYSNIQLSNTAKLCSGGTKNAFFDSFWIPFNLHSELILSPDDIWIAICLGFSHHVNTNSEQLREMFLDHKGKKTLVVEYPPDENPFSKGFRWDVILQGFEQAISQNTKQGISEVLVADFSTTGAIERVVSQIVLMDTFKKYFEYKMCPLCGFTKVNFMGTLEDWQKIVEKAKALRKYKCEFWIDQLVPVLEQFVKTYKGEFDLDFWNNGFCHNYGVHGSGSGASKVINGWILTFFPYDIHDKVLLTEHYSKKRVKLKDIPNSSAKVPFKLLLSDGTLHDLVFLAGFANVLNENGKFRPQMTAALAKGGSNEKINEFDKLFENTEENPGDFLAQLRKYFDKTREEKDEN